MLRREMGLTPEQRKHVTGEWPLAATRAPEGQDKVSVPLRDHMEPEKVGRSQRVGARPPETLIRVAELGQDEDVLAHRSDGPYEVRGGPGVAARCPWAA